MTGPLSSYYCQNCTELQKRPNDLQTAVNLNRHTIERLKAENEMLKTIASKAYVLINSEDLFPAYSDLETAVDEATDAGLYTAALAMYDHFWQHGDEIINEDVMASLWQRLAAMQLKESAS